MARLVLVKIGVDVIQFDEPAFNVCVYAEEVRGNPCRIIGPPQNTLGMNLNG